MRPAFGWTIIAAGLLFVALASTVCPPTDHLPAIIAILSLLALLVSLIDCAQMIAKRSITPLARPYLLGTIDAVGILFIGWLFVRTMKAGTL